MFDMSMLSSNLFTLAVQQSLPADALHSLNPQLHILRKLPHDTCSGQQFVP